MRSDIDVRVKLNRDNAAPGVEVLFRGKRRVVEEVSGPGVYLKATRKGRPRDYLYFYECEQFGVMLAALGD